MNPGCRASRANIDRDEPSVRHMRADETSVELTGEVDVVDEATSSPQQALVLDPQLACADVLLGAIASGWCCLSEHSPNLSHGSRSNRGAHV